jgi:hypothetical protein
MHEVWNLTSWYVHASNVSEKTFEYARFSNVKSFLVHHIADPCVTKVVLFLQPSLKPIDYSKSSVVRTSIFRTNKYTHICEDGY